MNIALPGSMKAFVQRQVDREGFSSVSEYMRALIRADQQRTAQEEFDAELRKRLDSGGATPLTADAWQAIQHEGRRRCAARHQPASQESSRAKKP